MEEGGFVPDKGQQRILEIYLKEKNIPTLVVGLAAPGTGKTTTIVRLVLQLIALGRAAPIQNFLVLTFTKRTRGDILKKIQKEGGMELAKRCQKYVRNFHSLAFTSLFWDTVLTDSQINNKIEELIAEASQNTDRMVTFYQIKRIKKQIKQAIAFGNIQETIDRLQENNIFEANIMESYISWLDQNFQKESRISYDYSLIKFYENLQKGKNPAGINLKEIDLLVVDEFQDSNPAQMKIVQAILKKNPNMKLLLLGDIDQTIYTWRGTDLIFLDEFIRDYEQRGEYQPVYLQNTHRLSPEVLRLSQILINSRPNFSKFREYYYKNYVPNPLNKINNHRPLVFQFQSEYSEVSWVIDKIRQLVDQKNGIRYKDITVLLRSFRFTDFFKKFQFQNTRQAVQKKKEEIPFILKSQESHHVLQAILSWFVYFYKKNNFKNESVKQEIKSMVSHMNCKSALDKMVKENTIDRNSVSKKKMNEDYVRWNHFFIDFKTISKLVEQKTESFSDIFKEVYNILLKSERCEELNDIQRDEFFEYIGVLETYISRQKRKDDPIYSILQILIIRHIYVIKPERKSGKGKADDKRKPKKSNNQSLLQFFPTLKVKGKRNLTFMDLVKQRSQLESFETQQQRMEERRKRQQIKLKYKSEADAVHFQTTYGAKGLQFKVVFICSLNYDIYHEDFETYIKAKTDRRSGNNDAQRQMQRQHEYKRFIVRQEEELRVIYTALTRTSKYCFITSSINDCRKYEGSSKHPHFQTLQKNTDNENVPFDEEKDGIFRKEYEQYIKRMNPKRSEDRNEDSSQTLLFPHKEEKIG